MRPSSLALLGLFVGLIGCSGTPEIASPPAEPSVETLLVLTQESSPVDAGFRADTLPELRKLADRLGMELVEMDAGAGAPDGITITPTIVVQNHRGRAIFQGRFTELDRLEKFILTVRHVPQGDSRLQRDGVGRWHEGRPVRESEFCKICRL